MPKPRSDRIANHFEEALRGKVGCEVDIKKGFSILMWSIALNLHPYIRSPIVIYQIMHALSSLFWESNQTVRVKNASEIT